MTAGAQELDARVAEYVSRGFEVQSRTPSQVVLVRKRRIGWFWNTLLVVVTGGLWLIYVVYRALNRKTDRVVFTVDAQGRVRRS